MTKRELHNKRDACELAYKYGDFNQCHRILNILEVENYHGLVELLVKNDWSAAYRWVENNC